MNLIFTEEKKFSPQDVQELFLSVGWASGRYPTRLYSALMHSSTVLTAWDGNRLVGLMRALDDGGMLAFLHYALVHPTYQGKGIAGKLIELMKEKYQDYFYINLMTEESKNISFYEKYGFRRLTEGGAMQLQNTFISDETI